MTIFSIEDRVDIGRYTAENENSAVVRNYSVGESTMCLFKKKYLTELRARVKNRGSEPVRVIAVGQRGCPLLLGELDKKGSGVYKSAKECRRLCWN